MSQGWRNWGGVLAGAIVNGFLLPVLIAQYPEFFERNPYALPVFVGLTLLCLVPLLWHYLSSFHALVNGRWSRTPVAWLIVMAAGAIMGSGIAALGYSLFIRHQQHLSEQDTTRQPPLPAAPVATVSVRLKYSSTQTIELSSVPGDYNETLNLDNAGTMTQVGTANLQEVGMVLMSSPSLRIERPNGKTSYQASADGVTFDFPAADKQGVTIRGAKVFQASAEDSFVFNRFKAQSHIVSVGQRKFRVMLMEIRDKSRKKHRLIQYTFGINEE